MAGSRVGPAILLSRLQSNAKTKSCGPHFGADALPSVTRRLKIAGSKREAMTKPLFATFAALFAVRTAGRIGGILRTL